MRLRRMPTVSAGLLVVLAGSLTACSSGGGGSVNLQIASYVGENSITGTGLEQWAAAVDDASDGSITMDIAPSGSLLAATDTLPGVGDGRADVGAFTYIYHPAELPLTHIINVPYTTENVPAQEKAFLDLYESSDAFRKEFESQGVRLLYVNVVTPTLLGCNEPIEDLSDLDGRTVRAAGLVAEAFEAVGADVATIPITEVRDAVSKGVVDCWSTLSMDLATDYSLQDETDYIYDFGYGNYGLSAVAINLDVWNSLSDEQQDVLTEESSKMPERDAEITGERIAEGCAAVEKAGAKLIALPDDLREEWKAAIGTRIDEKYESMSPDAGEFAEEYAAALEAAEKEFPDFEPPLAKCEQS